MVIMGELSDAPFGWSIVPDYLNNLNRPTYHEYRNLTNTTPLDLLGPGGFSKVAGESCEYHLEHDREH